VPDLKDSRIAVIGGAGFIGSHIADQLLTEDVAEVVVLDNFVRGTRSNLAGAVEDPRVTLIEGSIVDSALVRDVVQGSDYAFLCAALWLYECVHEPRQAIDVNIGGTFNVIEACHEAGVRKVVYSSSASVYGNAVESPMTEDHPLNNRTMYGATKIAGEQMFRAVHEQHGLDYVGLRYMNVYGPRMDYKGAYVSVIMSMLDRLDAGERPQVHGDGSAAYDFVHVDDVARANVLALKSSATDVNLNVGTGTRTTIAELVSALLELTGSDIEPEFIPAAQQFVTERVGATELAEALIGFRATVAYRDGLQSVIAWREGDKAAAGVQRADG
jgi:UDP-glucose 4-epimerase